MSDAQRTDAKIDHAIDYVELAVASTEAAKAFYGAAFGWRFTDYGPSYTEFTDGRLTGGFNATEPVAPGHTRGGPLVILYAANLEATMRSVIAAGGRVIKPIYPFPGGRRFHFADPDGYEFAVWSAT